MKQQKIVFKTIFTIYFNLSLLAKFTNKFIVH